MRTRSLLVIGVTAITASLLLGVAGLATGQMAQWSIAAPGGMMGRTFGGGGGDIGMDRAVKIAQDVATTYSGGGLAADEVIEFTNNYYASIREKGTGIGAFEILIDHASGQVTREPGPDMMWNAKYGMMSGGMMGGFGFTTSEPMSVTRSRHRTSHNNGSTLISPAPRRGCLTASTAITPSTSRRPDSWSGCFP